VCLGRRELVSSRRRWSGVASGAGPWCVEYGVDMVEMNEVEWSFDVGSEVFSECSSML
jgi:hypothetical protein